MKHSGALAAFFIAWLANCQPAATPVKTVPVDIENGVIPGETPVAPHKLFELSPGSSVLMSNLGIVDPVGTTIVQDFDGDGITNSKETVSNFWVADYPMIESSVAPPITMEIKILKDKTGKSSSIVSDITSSDMESRRNRGSEKFHQNQLALRTVQYKYGKSSNSGSSFDANVDGEAVAAIATGGASVPISAAAKAAGSVAGGGADSAPASGGGGLSLGFSNSNSSSHSVSMDKFATKPYRNNIDRSATSVTNNSAKNRARKYRNERNLKVDETSTVETNAGFVRAALYIKNNSVNMPVKLSNILCSLLFETATGELIPVRSFELRNQDYSMFSVEVYGASEFGPYVVELSGLNTVEIENAIALGYTPKIYIVDYKMTHVADSNYRASLSSSFTGDNLKIIEENAKGRTALIKMIGPGMRDMYRVTAFNVDSEDPADPCKLSGPANTASPGITLKKALERISCSGVDIEFDHYIFDFKETDMEPYFDQPVYSHSIRSINGVANHFPCHAMVPGIDHGGNSVEACLVRVRDLTPEEDTQVGLWVIFDNGKYFDKARIKTDGSGAPIYFEGTTPVAEAIHSKVWAGDHYDIVYLSMDDFVQREQEYGSNPLETGETFFLNTRWNRDYLGANPDYPQTNSVLLGQAGLGEKIEISVELKDNWVLNPDFGSPEMTPDYLKYDSFSYLWQKDDVTLHDMDKAFDFQVNFDQGGTRDHWYNILRTDLSATPDSNAVLVGVKTCGQSWNFLSQVFTVCVQVPAALDGVASDGVVNVYLRPTPNNAYREVIWPREPASINRFQATLYESAATGDLTIRLVNGTGEITPGSEAGNTVHVGLNQYTIASVQEEGHKVDVFLGTATTAGYLKGEMVTIGALSGTIWEDSGAGTSVLSILPDAASSKVISDLAFDTFSYKGQYLSVGADLYLVQEIKTVGQISNITLQSALLEDHNRSEPVFIKGSVVSSPVYIVETSNFTIDWNAEVQNAPTGLVPDYSSMLYTGLIGGCQNGLDSLNLPSPGCQGYPVDSIIANWAGAGAFENDWNDSSNYFSYLSGSLNPLVFAPTNRSSMSLEIAPANVAVTGSSATVQKSNTVAASGTGRSLVVWRESTDGVNFDVKGRIYENASNQSLSAAFTISDVAGDHRNLQVSASGDKAIVVWQSDVPGTWDVLGRVIDLSTPAAPLANPVIVVNTVTAGSQVLPQVDTDGDLAVVAFMTTGSPRNTIHGRLISLTGLHTGPDYDSEFAVTTTFKMDDVQVAFQNKKIVFVYSRRFTYVDVITYTAYDTYMRLYTTEPLTAVSNSVVCKTQWPSEYNNPPVPNRRWPQIGLNADGSKGLVGLYRSINNYDLYATKFDFATASCSPLITLAANTGTQGALTLDVQGNYAVSTWESNQGGLYQVWAMVTDLTTGVSSPSFLVNTPGTGNERYPEVVVQGDKALITWKAVDQKEVRGQIIDLVNARTVDTTDFLIGFLDATETLRPAMTYDGENGMVFWHEQDIFNRHLIEGQSYKIHLADTLFLRYGLNNFFIAPLIERNYAVKARLIY